MEKKIYRDEDVSLAILKDKVIAVLGYGIQGRSQALNLRDSGLNVIVGAAKGRKGWDNAKKDGFEVMSIAEATKKSDIAHVLLADPIQPQIYKESIHDNLNANSTLCFCHGFNILYGGIEPPEDVNVILFVPNAPGHLVREKYLEGSGIYGAIAIDRDVTGEAKEIILAIAKGVGSTRVGVVEVSFQEETEGDNFEEQVLYGGTIHLMRAIFDTMVDNGYNPYFAYAKAIRSLRSVVDLMDQIGIEDYITNHSSRTCEFAIRMSGPKVINLDAIKEIFDKTESGAFASSWLQEWELGLPQLNRMRRRRSESIMEKIGRDWRKQFK